MLLGLARVVAREEGDPRGPVDNPGMTVTVDSQGVQAPGYVFRNECAKPSPWQAEWIWLAKDSPAAGGMFRKEVVLSEAPREVKAWVSADARYRLYVNGVLVSRGPADIGRDFQRGSTHRWLYDFRQLAPFFRKGSNVISAEVFRQGSAGSSVSRGVPGFLFEAEFTGTDGRRTTAKTDASWRSRGAGQFPDRSTFATALEPGGWRLAGFDDSVWSESRVQKDVWEERVPSEIPPLMEARYPVLRVEGMPDDRVFTRDGRFTVVFDRVLSAYPTLRVKGGKGAELTIQAHRAFKVLLGGGDQFIEVPFMDEIAPSFTVSVRQVAEPVEIADVGANFTSQPLDYRGDFACNDEALNRIWRASRWAVQICLQTHHLDSPNHQEPISDAGDYVVEDLVNDYAFAQPWLARQDIRKFAWLLKDLQYENFHTSYSLAWLQMLMDYYDYTGDRSLVVEMAPYVRELLDTFTSWRGPNGIISNAPNYMFMDWVQIAGIACHHPPAVIGQGYMTAFYYHGLDMASRVAAMAGDSARVERYAGLREETKAAFARELWVPERGCFRDGKPFQTSVKPGKWLPPDTAIETFSPHVNLLSVLYDLAPREQQGAIVDKFMAEGPLNTTPWFMHWVFQAIDHAGRFDRYGTAQMRRWQIVPATQSFHEMWAGGDLSHGWCSTPLVQMSSRVLGVTPAAPGFKTISVRPQIGDLKWAKGTVPTPLGDVRVSWALVDGGWQLDLTVPAGADAEVSLPVSRFDHAIVTRDEEGADRLVRVPSGTHHFRISGIYRPLSP